MAFLTFLSSLFWPAATLAVAYLAYRAHAFHVTSTRANVDASLAARIKALEDFRDVVKNRPGIKP